MDDWKQGIEASAGRCHSDGVGSRAGFSRVAQSSNNRAYHLAMHTLLTRLVRARIGIAAARSGSWGDMTEMHDTHCIGSNRFNKRPNAYSDCSSSPHT